MIKDRPSVELVDLPCFGRPARLVWRKRRWSCPDAVCAMRSWTEELREIAAPRLVMTDRAGRWVTEQVGRHGRTVNEVAGELGCDWHTVNDTVIAYGTALVDDDPDRIGEPTALGLDETLFVRIGPRHRQAWSTSIVDVRAAVCWTLCLVAVRWSRAGGSRREERMAREHRIRNVGSVGPVSGGVRHDAPRRGPGRRSVPRGEAREPQAR